MLQDLFYISVIVMALTATTVLIVFVYIMIKSYKAVSEMLNKAQATAGHVQDTLSELGEQGSNVLKLFTKEGQQAISSSTLISLLMNGYFLFRTIFGKKRR